MRTIRSKGMRLAILLASVFTVIASSSDLASGEIQAEGTSDRAEAEAALTVPDFVPDLESALGGAYGGVWFDAADAQLHVGVASARDRQVAEAVAGRAGLARYVTATAVSSSWRQLIDAQGRWDRRLAGLLARGEASTGLLPQDNAVEVEISPSVSAAERESLEREAMASAVEIRIRPVQHSLRIETQAGRCVKFVEDNANCDPTIVAGTTIQSGSKKCTAGPAFKLFPPNKDTTATFVMTAGHCIAATGGNTQTWYAFNKAGEKKELGESVEFLNKELDVGLIKLTNKPNYWIAETQTPVEPALAKWSKTEETEPVAVTGQGEPTVGKKSCISGQSTSTHCGEIKKLNVTAGEVKGLVKVAGGSTDDGDSGAPWYTEGTSLIEGTHVGSVPGTTESLFMPLDRSLGLFGLKTQILMLLPGNKERPKCPMKAGKCFLEAATYPFEAFSYGDVEFGAPPLPIDCEQVFATSSETEFEIVPFYGSCSMFGIFSAVVNTGECHWTIDLVEELAADEFDADADLVCGAEPMTISTFTCELEIGSQEGLGPVTLTSNTEFGVVTADFDITELAYTVTKDGVSCPFSGTGPKNDGTFSSVEDIWIEGFEHEIWVAEP